MHALPKDLLLAIAPFLDHKALARARQTCQTLEKAFDQPLFDALNAFHNAKHIDILLRDGCVPYLKKHPRVEYACGRWQLTGSTFVRFTCPLHADDLLDLCNGLGRQTYQILLFGKKSLSLEQGKMLARAIQRAEAKSFVTNNHLPNVSDFLRNPSLWYFYMSGQDVSSQVADICNAMKETTVRTIEFVNCGLREQDAIDIISSAGPHTEKINLPAHDRNPKEQKRITHFARKFHRLTVNV